MRYRIRHITSYKYANRVSHCYNLAHMIPRTTRRQTCHSSRIDIDPVVASSSQREDYFGNTAYHFEIQAPHKNLIITATTDVETHAQIGEDNLDLGRTCAEARRQMQSLKVEDVILAREYLIDSSMIRAGNELRAYAQDLFTDDRPLLSAVADLTERIYKEFTYSPLATTIATPIAEVMANK
ncbi:MAG: transglutaminase N-terminal domain-containing protein, partial [Oleibacter sp.]|nr:transglutaminase N-terminal domain-containing protein [Thalassolituus sp.]